MSTDRFPISDSGFNKMKSELEALKSVERPSVIISIAEARSHGDLSENAEYHAAKEKQGFIEAKISDLENKLARSQIVDISKITGNTVKYGATVEILDEDTEKQISYKIVSDYEADVSKGWISISSPLAKSLTSKELGDSVEFTTPKYTKYYKIISVKYI
ncbi:MAG: transcription elongation factor GreA [Candidatus Midichloriaceae bacterium]|jgi:transcription elongation factor GreA